jgi:hypothetical protein
VLQVFAWDAKDRYPTPAELRCMVFLALVEGAHGIGYYSYGTVTGKPKTTIAEAQPELWKSVKPLNREAADIGPRLLAGKPCEDAVLKANPSLRMKLVRETDGPLALLVNSAPEPQTATLTAKGSDIHRLLLPDGKTVEFIEGTARIPLEPFGAVIIRLKSKP